MLIFSSVLFLLLFSHSFVGRARDYILKSVTIMPNDIGRLNSMTYLKISSIVVQFYRNLEDNDIRIRVLSHTRIHEIYIDLYIFSYWKALKILNITIRIPLRKNPILKL